MWLRQLTRLDHILNGCVLLLGLAIGSIAVSTTCTILHRIEVLLLLCTISSFLLSVWIPIRLLPTNLTFKLVIDSALKFFFVVVSIINMVHDGISNSALKMALFVLSIIQIVIILITLTIGIIIWKNKQVYDEGVGSDIEKDSQFTANTQVDSVMASKVSSKPNSYDHPGTSSSASSKTKHSEMAPLSPTFTFNGNHSKTNSIDYNNWMNVNPKHTSNEMGAPTHSKSVPNFHVDREYYLEDNYDETGSKIDKGQHKLANAKTETDINTHINAGHIPRENKSHETLIPNCNSDNSIHQIADISHEYSKRPKSGTLADFKSKSSPNFNKNFKTNKRQERWKSINDEKVFLKNINQSLLPSVLKQGESPILALKRKQQSLDFDNASEKTIGNNMSEDIDYSKSYSQPNLYYPHSSNSDTPDEGDEDENSLNLPYISEFDDGLKGSGEPDIDHDAFKDFDQEARIEYENEVDEFKIPKSIDKKQWIPNSEVKSLNHISLNEWNENYQSYQNFRSRSGANLNIPGISRLISHPNMVLGTDKLGGPSDSSMLFPPTDHRADNIDNLSDLYSDSNSANNNQDNHIIDNNSDYNLEPRLEKEFGNELPLFTHSNRSVSAPSLQTFRNVSNNSQKSDNFSHTESNAAEDILRYSTPPPLNTDVEEPVKSSPIKRLYSSPKKLFRKSIDSDLNNFKDTKSEVATNLPSYHHHTHNNSTMSTQFSLYSTSSKSSPKRSSLSTSRKSKLHQHNPSWNISTPNSPKRSKSLSPRKSFKSFMSGKKLFQSQDTYIPNSHTMAIPPPTLLKQAVVRKSTNHEELDIWDSHTAKSSNNSRISSLPSAVIGEYDREKWNTLKELSNK